MLSQLSGSCVWRLLCAPLGQRGLKCGAGAGRSLSLAPSEVWGKLSFIFQAGGHPVPVATPCGGGGMQSPERAVAAPNSSSAPSHPHPRGQLHPSLPLSTWGDPWGSLAPAQWPLPATRVADDGKHGQLVRLSCLAPEVRCFV